MKRRRDRIIGFIKQLRNRLSHQGESGDLLPASATDAFLPATEPIDEDLETENIGEEPETVNTEVEPDIFPLKLIEINQKPLGELDGSWTIEEALHFHPKASVVLASYNLPNCDHCAVRFHETIAEAAEAYEIDLHALIKELLALNRDR